MLTVLIREWTGHERIRQTREVRSEPPSEFRPGGFVYYIDRDDGEPCDRIDGAHASTIYVMNDAGKTVASYHFTREPKVEAALAA